MSQVVKQRLGALLAGLCLAASFALVAPTEASAGSKECTHTHSTLWYGLTIVEYWYESGNWQYVGSQLMHVHRGTKIVKMLPPFSVSTSQYSFYCTT